MTVCLLDNYAGAVIYGTSHLGRDFGRWMGGLLAFPARVRPLENLRKFRLASALPLFEQDHSQLLSPLFEQNDSAVRGLENRALFQLVSILPKKG